MERDHTTIQQALNALGPRGGVVRLEAADYAIRQDLTLPSNTILEGAGAATQLVLSPGVSVIMSGKANVRIRNLTVNADAHAANQRAIVISNCRDVAVQDCWVLNCGGFGVFLAGNQGNETGRIRVTGCRLGGKGNNDVIGGGPMTADATVSEVIIADNFIQQDCTVGQYRNAIDIVACTRTIISKNFVDGSIVLGGEKIPHVSVDISHNIVRPAINAAFCQISLLASSNAGETDVSHSIRIVGNDVTAGQIYVQGQKSTVSRTNLVLIQSNIVKGLSTHADPGVNRGIIASHASNVIIDNNIVDGATKSIVSGDVAALHIGPTNLLLNYKTNIETDQLTSRV